MRPVLRNLLIVVACLAAAGLAALVWSLSQGDGGDAVADHGSRSPAMPSPAPSTASSPEPSPATPSPTPSLQQIELRGDDLAVTRIGAPKEEAVAAVAAVLGPGDTSPSGVSCVGSDSEVVWPDLRLGFDAEDRLNGWSVGTPRLKTPSGVHVGTTVATLREVYGDDLILYPPNPDMGHAYGVRNVEMVGFLSGDRPQDTVTGLANGACSGP